MDEVTCNMTIAVIMVHLACQEVEYLWRKTKTAKLSKKRPSTSCFRACALSAVSAASRLADRLIVVELVPSFYSI